MKTIAELKTELSKFPDTALCYAYEGEVVGVVVVTSDAARQLGVIFCGEGDEPERPTET